jgi:predicted Zn-dependent protease
MIHKTILSLILASLLSGCVAARPAIPAGEIPQQFSVSAEDEQFGQEVLGELSDQYKLSTNDSDINRVRDIANRITGATSAASNPWNIYVFNDDSFPNAAATRGNYIFVWSGIIRKVQDDAELATVIAHEVAHVLAGHVMPTPAEEVNEMLSGVAGEVVSQVVAQGSYGAAAGLAGALAQTVIQAALVNPQQQQKELEADQIGIYLMADAGYDPQYAVEFWRRLQSDADLGGGGLGMLSSHPASADRLRQLEQHLPSAKLRYEQKRSGVNPSISPNPSSFGRSGSDSFAIDEPRNRPAGNPQRPQQPRPLPSGSLPRTWSVVEYSTVVRRDPNPGSAEVAELAQGTAVTVTGRRGGWLEITAPERGYVMGRDLTPR